MSSHANVVFATWSITTYLENVAEDVIISALPLSFDYGLYQLLMTIRFGGTLVLESSFAYPAQFLKRLASRAGHWFSRACRPSLRCCCRWTLRGST